MLRETMSGEQDPVARSSSLAVVGVRFHEFVDDGSYTTYELSDLVVVDDQLPRQVCGLMRLLVGTGTTLDHRKSNHET
jgi:hypothetical protein